MSAAAPLARKRPGAHVLSRLALGVCGLYAGIWHSTWVDSLGFLAYAVFLAALPTLALLSTAKFWAGYLLAHAARTEASYAGVLRWDARLQLLASFALAFFLGYAYAVNSFRQTAVLWVLVPAIGYLALASIQAVRQTSTCFGPGGTRLRDAEPLDRPAPTPMPVCSTTTAPQEDTQSFPASYPTENFRSLAGMTALKEQLGQIISSFKSYPSRRGAVSDRNGILLYGPPGNGKTVFARAIAAELGLRFMKLSVADLVTKWINGTPEILRALFEQARREPTVLFFDEFDAIATSRSSDGNMHHEDKKAVNALLALIDEARAHRVVLVAATNYPDHLDQAIVRDGRFDFRVEVPYPDFEARRAIIEGLCAKHRLNASEPVVEKVAALWERRSVAFIESTIKRLRDNGAATRGKPTLVSDFKQAAREASRRSSAIPKEGPKVSELVMPTTVRVEVDSLLHRLRRWETVAERGGEPPSGVLLYGPPGTGKTQLVRALARELGDWHVFEVNTTDVLRDPGKFRTLVDQAADHRPAFVFLDEAEELLRDRHLSASSAATNEILKTMDGLMGRVPELVFVAATNHPEVIDAAATRGGRFSEVIAMPLLSGRDLVDLLASEMRKRKGVHLAADISAEAIAQRLHETSAADAVTVLRKAVNYTLTADTSRPVCMRDIERAALSLAQRG